jgi:hypothetical protein
MQGQALSGAFAQLLRYTDNDLKADVGKAQYKWVKSGYCFK